MKPMTEAVVLNITKSYTERQECTNTQKHLPDSDVYEVARGAWTLSKDGRNKVEYALAAVDKKVVGVYHIKRWNQSVRDGKDENNRDKWVFERQDAEDTIRDGCMGHKIEDIDDLEMGQSSFCYVQLVRSADGSIDIKRANK